ncbi:MAG: hypothetical protein V2I27_02285 [Erythrobacter sp.]|nr:hypothetical protein [Erythrobacter sp.]
MRVRPYWPELALIIGVLAIGVLGFWELSLGPAAAPRFHHHVHLMTAFGWLLLLLG